MLAGCDRADIGEQPYLLTLQGYSFFWFELVPPPLQPGQVTFDDGSPQTLEQYSKDVTAFLMWAAEPHMVARKRIGFQVMIFLIVLAGLMYFTKKKVWADAH